MGGLQVVSAPDPNLSDVELGEWLAVIARGISGLVIEFAVEERGDAELRSAAGFLLGDLARITEAAGRRIAGGTFMLAEDHEDGLPGEQLERLRDMLRLLVAEPLVFESSSIDFAREAIAKRLERDIVRVVGTVGPRTRGRGR